MNLKSFKSQSYEWTKLTIGYRMYRRFCSYNYQYPVGKHTAIFFSLQGNPPIVMRWSLFVPIAELGFVLF